MAGHVVTLTTALDRAYRWQCDRYKAAWTSTLHEETSIVYGPLEPDDEEKARFLAAGTCVCGVTFWPSAFDVKLLWALWDAPRDGNGDEIWKQGKPVGLVISHQHPDLDRVADAWLHSKNSLVCIDFRGTLVDYAVRARAVAFVPSRQRRQTHIHMH